MKVTNICNKLAAALVAGGMLSPSAALAADLDLNLVINGGFENVDDQTTGPFGTKLILDWNHAGSGAFAYSHDPNNSAADYANGGSYTGTPFLGGGTYYFTGGSNGAAQSFANALKQDIDVTGGASGALIATGNAAYSLDALFSGFDEQPDHGIVDLQFLDSAGAVLGMPSSLTPGGNVQAWTPLSTGGVIPIGTETVRVSAYASPDFEGGTSDGYIDNIDFQVTDEVILPTLELRVDRNDGSLILSNRTGSPVNISGYQITSAFEGLNPASWQSIADHYDADSGGAVDGANNWTELTQAGDHGDLSEGDLASGNGGSLNHTQSINLGNAGAWIRTPNEDLVFQYISGGNVVTGLVKFDGGASYAQGDLNADGIVNSSDWAILRSHQHTDLSGKSLAEAYLLGDLTGDKVNNHADFVAFKNGYDAVNGVGAFQAMIATAVPEPTSVVLLLTSGLLLLTGARRQS